MSEYTIKARPTIYNGIKMRSRLEARFAAYLDATAPKRWRYEPECYGDGNGQYLPDFVVGDHTYIEIKPTAAHAAGALEGMHRILASDPAAMLMVVVPDGDGWLWVDVCDPRAHIPTDKSFGGLQDGIEPTGTCRCDRPRTVNTFGGIIAERSGYGSHMHCRHCGGMYTHLVEANPHQAGSDGTRFCVTLRFSCEYCYKLTDVEVTNHKGYTIFELSDVS